MMTRIFDVRTLVLGIAVAAALAGGCAGTRKAESVEPVNAGLSGMSNPGDGGGAAPIAADAGLPESGKGWGSLDRAATEGSVDLNRVLAASSSPSDASATKSLGDTRGREAAGPGARGTRGTRAARGAAAPAEVSAELAEDESLIAVRVDPDRSIEAYAAGGGAAAMTWRDSAGVLASGPAPASLEARISELAGMLAAMLRQKAAASESPIREYLLLAAVDPLDGSPGSRHADEASVMASPEGVAVWRAVQDLMSRAAQASPDPCAEEELSRTLIEGAARVEEARPMRISRAVLCRQVAGFGRYQPAGAGPFLAGQTQRLIVYVELENFAHRAAKPDDESGPEMAGAGEKWAVEVSQELDLRHSKDEVQAWYRPQQTVVDVSRNKRRDFFVRQIVELPATLSVGSYSLKVVMRDRTTGASDEAVIPITVVADPTLAGVQEPLPHD